LKWFVMVLAIVVFLYAGFLVWQLLRAPAAQEPVRGAPSVEVEQALPVPAEPVAADPGATEAESADAKNAPPPPDEATKAPERKSSTASPRPRRRRPRPKSQRVVKPAAEPGKPTKKAAPPAPAPAPKPDPLDIDIQNPYRN